MKILFLALVAIVISASASLSLAARCNIDLHTLIYPVPVGHYGYELTAYPTANHNIKWYLITYSLFPKQELSRIPVSVTAWGAHERYEGQEANGTKVYVVIDRSDSFSLAPLNYKTLVSPDLNSTPSKKFSYTAQRINPQYPNDVGGGVLGRLDTCN